MFIDRMDLCNRTRFIIKYSRQRERKKKRFSVFFSFQLFRLRRRNKLDLKELHLDGKWLRKKRNQFIGYARNNHLN